MDISLEAAIGESARILDDALARARMELAELNERRLHLEALIARAEAVQRAQDVTPTLARGSTLHDAIALVLEDNGNPWTSARQLADAINGRGLYSRKDGEPVPVSQIHARVQSHTYAHLFEKNGPRIRLRKVRASKER